MTPPRAARPGPASRALAARGARREPAPLLGIMDGTPPIAWARARGAVVEDVDGNRYLDLTGGFGADLVGHANPRVVAAVRRAAGRLLHGLADAAPHPERVRLAEELAARGPFRGGMVHFASSGAEAVDIALKTASLVTGRPGVVAFDDGYHGTSLGALRGTGRAAFREPFKALLAPTTLRVPFADCFRCPYRLTWPASGLACLAAALAEIDAWNADSARPPLGAWIVEPVIGREGLIVPPPGFLAALGRAARARGLLVIADEILTGGGRTGRWWASGPLKPDLVIVGKGIAGGMPLAAVLGPRRVLRIWNRPGEALHTTTHLAHPLAVAGARAALAEIARRDLPGRALAIGRRLAAGLSRLQQRHTALGDVRGVGAMWGLDLVTDRASRAPDPATAAAVARGLAARGCLALAAGRHGNVIALTPPLTISRRQLDAALAALDGALSQLDHGPGRR
ncbi:MAG: aspartate aminotransferase family protein [Gemmatimonadota bacterium]